SWWQPAQEIRASLSSGSWLAWWIGPSWQALHFASLSAALPTIAAVHFVWPIGVKGMWHASHWFSQVAWTRATVPCEASDRELSDQRDRLRTSHRRPLAHRPTPTSASTDRIS